MNDLIQTLSINRRGRDFAVGDLHGCYELLMNTLQTLQFDTARDRLFATGDLVDRGPHSLRCMELLNEDWFFSVKGNHDDATANRLLRNDSYALCGSEWLDRLESQADHHFNHLLFLAEQLDALPLAIEIETANGPIGIVHADIRGNSWTTFLQALTAGDYLAIQTALWSYRRGHRLQDRDHIPIPCPDEFRAEYDIEGLHRLLVGHSAARQPYGVGNWRCIDSAAFTTGILTVVDLTEI